MQLNILGPSLTILVLTSSSDVTAHHRRGSNSVIVPDLVNVVDCYSVDVHNPIDVPNFCRTSHFEQNLYFCGERVVKRLQGYCLHQSKLRRRNRFENAVDCGKQISDNSNERCIKQVDEYTYEVLRGQKNHLASKKKASNRSSRKSSLQ